MITPINLSKNRKVKQSFELHVYIETYLNSEFFKVRVKVGCLLVSNKKWRLKDAIFIVQNLYSHFIFIINARIRALNLNKKPDYLV